MSQTSKVRIIYGSIIAAFLLCWILFGETAVSQSLHMHQARKHILKIEEATRNLPEFRNVKFFAGTSHNGCLGVGGWVETESKRLELKSLIETTKPPVFVWYIVQVQNQIK